ncbi:hypothetical protein GCM10023094_03870 [Rhodococcus olei]|uniref:Uncharacterized protein n=1 Tax=Rhodococcus olei TaxID=2161675 RepID=A0ABP8NV90_9NOCA
MPVGGRAGAVEIVKLGADLGNQVPAHRIDIPVAFGSRPRAGLPFRRRYRTHGVTPRPGTGRVPPATAIETTGADTVSSPVAFSSPIGALTKNSPADAAVSSYRIASHHGPAGQ